MNIGASYNVGQFTAGINRKKVDQATIGTEDKQMEYSVAYAVNKELSVALNYSKAERDAVTAVATDEKVKSIAVGYNMGPVVLVGQYGKVDGKEGSVATSAEGDVLYLQLSTKF
jgi:predicted porin